VQEVCGAMQDCRNLICVPIEDAERGLQALKGPIDRRDITVVPDELHGKWGRWVVDLLVGRGA
jgi:hypothetical protein